MQNNSGTITTSHGEYISPFVFDMYDGFNKKPYSLDSCVDRLQGMCEVVFRKNNQTFSFSKLVMPKKYEIKNHDKKVVLGFSGGLDSVYQAIWLKESGWDVILYHLKGVNTYENGQATKHCLEIARGLGMIYEESVFKKKHNSQQWPENPIKNQLILSLMIDYCIDKDIRYISLGDDFNLSITDAVQGVNVTDAREITHSFIDGIRRYVDVRFIKVEECNKLERIQKLKEYGLENLYYSCVQAGRFNKSLHDKAEQKYGVNLFANNCGCYCRKCAMHNLLMYYGGEVEFPKEFVNKCWEVMWKNSYSADYELFRPDLPEKSRIKNLFDY